MDLIFLVLQQWMFSQVFGLQFSSMLYYESIIIVSYMLHLIKARRYWWKMKFCSSLVSYSEIKYKTL